MDELRQAAIDEACDHPKAEMTASPLRYAPAVALPPYSYVPGHGLPHPVNDPAGHLYGSRHEPPIAAAELALFPTEPTARRRALAALLAANSSWLYALDLLNAGYYWEAHEAWEGFWHALGRKSPEAQFVQGLILIAAAAVKIREGKPDGVRRHTQRAKELLRGLEAARLGDASGESKDILGLDPKSVRAVIAELETYRPECWHTSRTPVVRVLAESVRLASGRASS